MANPDRLYIEEEDKQLYEKLNEEFKNSKENKDLFLFALSIGFKYDIRRPIRKKFGFVRREYLMPKDWALLYSLVVKNNSIETLANDEEVFKIAEEYANAGIKILSEWIGSFGSFDKRLEREVYQFYEQIKDNA